MDYINLISSITGFHNPVKHNGLSVEEFLLLYIRRQAKLTFKEKNRIEFILAILSNWEGWCHNVKSHFPRTFQSGA